MGELDSAIHLASGEAKTTIDTLEKNQVLMRGEG